MFKQATFLAAALAAVLLQGSNAFLAPSPAAARATTKMMAGRASLDTLPRVLLTDTETGHSATVHLYGGLVSSYKAPHEVLGTRADAVFDGAKPPGVGLQCCWPQFGPGAIQQHGFARNSHWEVSAHSSTEPEVTLVLKDSAETRKIWDHAFELYMTVRLEKDHLFTRLTAKNTGKTSWDFTGALHSYYATSDVTRTTYTGKGLQGQTFVDKTKEPFVSSPVPSDEIPIKEFVEGVLPNYKGPMTLKGPRAKTTVEHVKGWTDYVLWAPLGNDAWGYKKFACLESGVVNSPVTVPAGGEWVGEMKISSRAG